MARIEELAEQYAKHISAPWPRTLAGSQRVIIVAYDKDLERTLRARKDLFEIATESAGHDWHEIDITDAFSAWIAKDEYRQEYFEAPEALQLKLSAEFAKEVADRIRKELAGEQVTENSVVAILGVGSLFGFTRLSAVLPLIEGDIRGRLVIFYPRIDNRTDWSYLAVMITAHAVGASL